jgi:hypothetical protein
MVNVDRGNYARTEDGEDDEKDCLDHFGGLQFNRDVLVYCLRYCTVAAVVAGVSNAREECKAGKRWVSRVLCVTSERLTLRM